MDKDQLSKEAEDSLPDDGFKGLEPIKEGLIAPAHGIAAIALNMAMKYHDMNMIKDGSLYQQYKVEGRNFRELHIDVVFETAIKIEAHLLGSSDRIGQLIVDALEVVIDEKEAEEETTSASDEGQQ